jgi:hypothetical protein
MGQPASTPYGEPGYPLQPFMPQPQMNQQAFNPYYAPGATWGTNPQAMLPGMVPAPPPNYAFSSLSNNMPTTPVSMPYGQNIVDLANSHFGQTLNHQGQNGVAQPETVVKSVETAKTPTPPSQSGKSLKDSTCRYALLTIS